MSTGENRPMYGWETLPWRKLERSVFKLQKRIYQASRRGDRKAVRRLQRLLTTSRAAKLLDRLFVVEYQ
jgi:RNA-directed DNA polymerase